MPIKYEFNAMYFIVKRSFCKNTYIHIRNEIDMLATNPAFENNFYQYHFSIVVYNYLSNTSYFE